MNIGNWIIYAGLLLIITGIAYKLNLLNWFGNLPGDIRYENKHTRVYFPIVSMLIVSIIVSLIAGVIRR